MSSDGELIAALAELIVALDRRLPRPGRPNEGCVADSAAALRSVAAAHIRALMDCDRDRALSVMDDDGSFIHA